MGEEKRRAALLDDAAVDLGDLEARVGLGAHRDEILFPAERVEEGAEVSHRASFSSVLVRSASSARRRTGPRMSSTGPSIGGNAASRSPLLSSARTDVGERDLRGRPAEDEPAGAPALAPEEAAVHEALEHLREERRGHLRRGRQLFHAAPFRGGAARVEERERGERDLLGAGEEHPVLPLRPRRGNGTARR